MIALASQCLLFRTDRGECIPFSPEMVSVELIGVGSGQFDAEFVKQAAGAVFYFFKHEEGRQTVSVGEFAEALEKVLHGFGQVAPPAVPAADCVAVREAAEGVFESDLDRLARESGWGCELVFFPLLRDELRRQLRQQPRVLRFHGLRRCVMQLAGARRWGSRCRVLEEQIVHYLRQCVGAEAGHPQLSLIVEG
jgi:hypothetical protein